MVKTNQYDNVNAKHQPHAPTRFEKIAIWEWDLVTDSVYYSADWKQLRGCDAKDVSPTPDLAIRFIHPDDKAKRKRLHGDLRAGKVQQIEFELRVKKGDGSWAQIAERTHAICNNDGQPIRLVGCQVDVSRDEQQQRIQTGNRSSAPLDDSFPVVLLHFEHQQCVYVNEYWSRLTGRSIESAMGDGWLESIHPDDRDVFTEFRQSHQEGIPGDSVVVEGISARHLNPDGSINWFLSTVRINYGMDGIAVSSSVLVMDVTDQRKLERQQDHLVDILQATPDFIGMATPDHKIVWLNKRLAEFRPDLNRKENPAVSLVHPEWANKIMRENGFPIAIEHGSWSGNAAIIDQDGNETPVSHVLIAHKGPDGSVESLSSIMRDISEQEKTERALRLSERNYVSLATTAPVGIFRLSDPTNCVYVNENWSKQTGLSLEDALGTGWMKVGHPDDMKTFQEKIEAFVTAPEQIDLDGFEARQILPDGSVHWVLCHLAKELDDDGNITGYVGTLSDIDRVKRAEEELKDLNQRLHNVLEFSSIGIWEWDCEHETLAWDEKMHQIYGVDVKNFRGLHSDWSDRIHPADFDRIMQEDTCRAESKRQLPQEFRIVRPNGDVRHIYGNVYSELDENGNPLRATGVNVDITDRREAEVALVESENNLQRIADHLPGLVYRYFMDADGNHGFQYLSSQARDLFGFEPAELIADCELLWQWLDPSDAGRLIARMRESASSLTRHVEEFRLRIPGRGVRWFQANGQPKKIENDCFVWDGVMLEITDRKEVELANDVLAKATKTKDEFLANMSHELRTPLTAILAMNEGMQQGMFGKTTPKQMESLNVVEQSGLHLLDLINEVLDLAKIASGQNELQLSYINVSELCKTCLNFVTQQAEQKRIELSCNVPWNLPKLKADEKRIRQVLINLLSNAVKFTPEGGQVKLEVETSQATTEGPASEILRISVTDNGAGINLDELESVFEPFVQIDSSLTRQHGGTGLGLSLVKQFVELHNGTVSVISEPSQGSRFTVDLPFRKAGLEQDDKSPNREQAAAAKISETEAEDSTVLPHGDDGERQPFILLAEDNDLVAKAIVPILEFYKFKVLHAKNGRLAVEMAQKHSPDLILMDIQMPEMDGLEATKKIRQIGELSKLPIIALSGFVRSEDSQRSIKAGASLFMAKPLRTKELIKNINRLLHQSRLTEKDTQTH